MAPRSAAVAPVLVVRSPVDEVPPVVVALVPLPARSPEFGSPPPVSSRTASTAAREHTDGGEQQGRRAAGAVGRGERRAARRAARGRAPARRRRRVVLARRTAGAGAAAADGSSSRGARRRGAAAVARLALAAARGGARGAAAGGSSWRGASVGRGRGGAGARRPRAARPRSRPRARSPWAGGRRGRAPSRGRRPRRARARPGGRRAGRAAARSRRARRWRRASRDSRARRPLNISKAIAATENTSAAAVAGSPSNSSGAMYAGVPSIDPVRVIPVAWPAEAIPRSASFTRSARSSRTFAGLTSRWITPCSWRWSTAAASGRRIAIAVAGASGPSRRRSARLGPSTYSMTSSTAPSSSIASNSVTMFGWLSAGGDAHLAAEARRALRPGVGMQALDRDAAVELGVLGEEHGRHRARAQAMEHTKAVGDECATPAARVRPFPLSPARSPRDHEALERLAQRRRDLDGAAGRAVDEHVDEPARRRGVAGLGANSPIS